MNKTEPANNPEREAPALEGELGTRYSGPQAAGWSTVLTWMENSLAALEHGEAQPVLKTPKVDAAGQPIDPAIREEIAQYLKSLRAELKEALMAAAPNEHDKLTARIFSDRQWPLEQFVRFRGEVERNLQPGGVTPGWHNLNLQGIRPVEIYTTVGPGRRFDEVRQAVVQLLEQSFHETPEVRINADAHTGSLVRHYIVEPLRADPGTARLVDWMRVRYEDSIPTPRRGFPPYYY